MIFYEIYLKSALKGLKKGIISLIFYIWYSENYNPFQKTIFQIIYWKENVFSPKY